MEYISTRNKNLQLSFKEIFLQGLAPDGGLFISKNIKKYSNNELNKMAKLNYIDLAKEIVSNFCKKDLHGKELEDIIKKSYSNFSVKNVVNIKKIGNFSLVELFHGPTLAFKDIAMQPIGNIYDEFNKSNNKKINCLVLDKFFLKNKKIQNLKIKKYYYTIKKKSEFTKYNKNNNLIFENL